ARTFRRKGFHRARPALSFSRFGTHRYPMIGIVIVTHGRLAQETIVAMEHMVGPQPNLRAVSIGPEDDIERRRREVGAAVKSVDRGQGVVVATDMYGGTPCNSALSWVERDRVAA